MPSDNHPWAQITIRNGEQDLQRVDTLLWGFGVLLVWTVLTGGVDQLSPPAPGFPLLLTCGSLALTSALGHGLLWLLRQNLPQDPP